MLSHDTQITTSLGKRLLIYTNSLRQGFTNKKHYCLAPHFSMFLSSLYIPVTTNMLSDFSSNSIWPGFLTDYLIPLRGVTVCVPSKASEHFIHPAAKEGFPMF